MPRTDEEDGKGERAHHTCDPELEEEEESEEEKEANAEETERVLQ